MNSKIIKVVLVGMLDSVHFAGWLSHFVGKGIVFYLFPSSPHRRLHPDVRDLTLRYPGVFVLPKYHAILGLPAWLLDQLLGNLIRSSVLRALIRRVKPDFAHGLELQHAGYLLGKAVESGGKQEFRTVITNYGSDIYWFQQFPKHRVQITKLLKQADVYLAECDRDILLARQLGFIGEIAPVFPNSGGFEETALAPLRLESRRTIAVKGYHGWVGRAKVALEAIEMISEELDQFQIVVVYSSNLVTRWKAHRVKKRTGLRIQALNKGALTRSQMKHLFESSAVYVGLSLSDGISTSMLEAMAFGAIPVQTSTACCDEWFESTGVALKDIERETVARGILTALELAKNPQNLEVNRQTVLRKASRVAVSKNAWMTYGV